jgi:hypothetical protein
MRSLTFVELNIIFFNTGKVLNNFSTSGELYKDLSILE